MLDTTVLPDKLYIIQVIKRNDALETLGQPGWPRTYYSNQETCPLCGKFLISCGKKRQKMKEDQCYLVSKDHCIDIIILGKKCKDSSLIVQPATLQLGLLDVGDTLLLSLDIIYQMQHLVRFLVCNLAG